MLMDTNGHTILSEDYVSYEVAKLLKEKGFDEKCSYEWGVPDIDGGYILQKWSIYNGEIRNSELINDAYSAPTLQMACKWLREVHNIFIEIYLPSHSEHEDTIYHGTYSFDIFNLNKKVYVYCTWNEKEFNSYEEAIEAAIKYTLENLI